MVFWVFFIRILLNGYAFDSRFWKFAHDGPWDSLGGSLIVFFAVRSLHMAGQKDATPNGDHR